MFEKILPYKEDFPDVLSEYISQILAAIKENKHHDYRRQLFIEFLRLGFGITPYEIDIEKKVKVAEVRGRIDALFKRTIFEFKVDLERERPAAILELKKYYESRPNPNDYIALLTDGLSFEVCLYENGQIVKTGFFKLSSSDPLSAFRYLDQFIFTSRAVRPESTDIVQRFGLHSAVFNSGRILLRSMFENIRDEPAVKVKLREWKSLLAKVYGSDIGDTNLFMRHTYLTVFSRLLVAKTIYPEEIRNAVDYRGLLTGEYFTKKNLPNLVEPDFFSWAIDTEEEENFIGFLAKLEGYLKVYDLHEVSEDVLKELYQNVVDPESRHSLGEYYTPDWLAEVMLESVGYREGILLDPACGSGTFLFSAVKRKRALGLKGQKLLEDVVSSIIGIDVHPLAVMMSKANLLLALTEEIKKYKKEIYLQVYLADTLLISNDPTKDYLPISVTKTEEFRIPFDTVERDINLDLFIDKMSAYAQRAVEGNKEKAFKGLLKSVSIPLSSTEMFFWRHNFGLLIKLLKNKRDSIWSFILKNAYRPAFLKFTKVDFVIGNPPWLSYRFIKDDAYKDRIKQLTFDLGLLEKTEVKLFTQMDTSTVFFRYCEREFLRPSGKIAFVMPKTTILPAKQHAAFQGGGVTEIYDLSDVSPLFNVRAAVLFHKKNKSLISDIPTKYFNGTLPVKNMEWKAARKYIMTESGTSSFLDADVRCAYYHQKFFQGATLVPRCFWFVEPMKGAAAHEKAPFLETSEEAKAEGKKPWIIELRGRIEEEFLFETVLAKGLLPFAISRRELIFLPVKADGNRTFLLDAEQLLGEGKENAAQWLSRANKIWEERRSSKNRSLSDRLNYNNTLINQHLFNENVLLYNTSGTNLTAALHKPIQKLCGFRINGFVADAKTYYFYPRSLQEGDYLCAILNSDVVNNLIKQYQPEGLYGERDIHRRPFEACEIPVFAEEEESHKRLAELGEVCRKEMKKIVQGFKGTTLGRIRLEVRRILAPQIRDINNLVSVVLKSSDIKTSRIRKKSRKANLDLFES